LKKYRAVVEGINECCTNIECEKALRGMKELKEKFEQDFKDEK